MRYTLIAGLLLCSSCQYIPGTAANVEAIVRSRFDAVLNDPRSAQYAGLTKSPDGLLICGRVNAKNRMGGYTGFEGFVFATQGDQHLWLESSQWPTGGHSTVLHRAYLERVAACTGKPIDQSELAADNASDSLAKEADRLEAMARGKR